jgi:TonB family protein
MASLWLQNLLSYSLQIALVAAVGALFLRLLRIRVPNVRVLCGQALIAVCLLLPAIQPRIPGKETSATVHVSTGPGTIVEPRQRSNAMPIPITTAVLFLIGAGILVRMGMLGLGFWRIRRYRHTSTIVPGAFENLQHRLGVVADFHISSDVPGPVTFGFFRPVIFMPENCARNQSIACHELVHVRRHDWLFTVAEECILSVFWFHPAMWWLVAEIQLTREEAVDREVVVLLNAREQYLESLLTLAASKAGLDLVPASLFLRKRHLKRRVASLLKEVSMSKLRLRSSMAALTAALVLAAWFGVKSFPLQAAPQENQDKIDAPGVAVQPSQVAILHRTPVAYPKEARAKRVQGTVVVEVSLTATGTVSDARVISGAEELRKAALESVLQWHFKADSQTATKTQVTVDFHLSEWVPARTHIMPALTPAAIGAESPVVSRIILRMPENLKEKLESRLTLREGDRLTQAAMADLAAAASDVDEHLNVNVRSSASGAVVTIRLLEGPAPDGGVTGGVIGGVPGGVSTGVIGGVLSATPVPPGPTKIRVGGNVAAMNLIHKVTPVYPPEAKQARIQGVVSIAVTIAKDGTIQDMQLISGHPLLVPSAQEAVAQWVYKPTLLNGNPIEVVTQVDVNFTLTQ